MSALGTNLIIDGNNLMHRSFWIGQRNNMFTSDGENVGAIFYFLNSIRSYAKKFDTQNMYIAWDKRINYKETNFRKEILKGEYKATRDQTGQADLYNQIDSIFPVLESLGLRNVFPYVLEGDDTIAWLSQNIKGMNIIISVDADLLQLIKNNVSVYNINTKKLITVDNFKQYTGIETPEKYLIYKCILGDTSDNIQGISGYGKVKATILANKYASSEFVLESEQKLIFDRNMKLIDLAYGLSISPDELQSYDEQISALIDTDVDLKEFKNYCNKYEFNKFIKEFKQWERLFRKNSRLTSILNAYFN